MFPIVNRIDSLFDDLFPSTLTFSNTSSYGKIVEDSDNFYVTYEVPGFNKENLSITVEDNILKIDGKIESKSVKKVFHRKLELGNSTQTDKIEAKVSDGMLEIKIPKAESQKPRQISIK